MSTTGYLGNAEGNAWLDANLMNRPGGTWIALHTAEPTPAGDTSTEVLGGGYVRQPADWSPASAKSTTTTNALTWSGMPACTVTWIAVWSDQYAGQMIACVQLSSPQDVESSEQFLEAPGDIAISL